MRLAGRRARALARHTDMSACAPPSRRDFPGTGTASISRARASRKPRGRPPRRPPGSRRAAARGVSARDALRVGRVLHLVVRHQEAVDASTRHGDRRVGERAARVVRQRLRDAHAAVRVPQSRNDTGSSNGSAQMLHEMVSKVRRPSAPWCSNSSTKRALRRKRCRVGHLLARLV